MDRNLVALKPALVWKHFAEIVRIPRPSSHEEKIRRYILDFARAQGLESKEDAAHNVYVRKPASKGMEDRKGVILQAHLDMVPQKNNDKEFDFTKDPIDAYIDGGWVTADGTTLGADNGIGVAAILAVLEDRTLKHGPLEALFTATEETGMDGANGLEKGLLHGDILLNLDSEEEGELYVGCAGGLDANMTFGYKAEPTPAGGYTAAKISVKGLKGGHSGIQIVCQRANANKVLFRFLNAAPCDVLLASVDGGGLRNAIPREAEAVAPQGVKPGTTAVEVIIREGRKNQVKRMLSKIHHPVIRLHRCNFAGLELKGVAKGSWRELTDREVQILKSGGIPPKQASAKRGGKPQDTPASRTRHHGSHGSAPKRNTYRERYTG